MLVAVGHGRRSTRCDWCAPATGAQTPWRVIGLGSRRSRPPAPCGAPISWPRASADSSPAVVRRHPRGSRPPRVYSWAASHRIGPRQRAHTASRCVCWCVLFCVFLAHRGWAIHAASGIRCAVRGVRRCRTSPAATPDQSPLPRRPRRVDRGCISTPSPPDAVMYDSLARAPTTFLHMCGAESTRHDTRGACGALGSLGGLAQGEKGSTSGQTSEMAFSAVSAGGWLSSAVYKHQWSEG